MTITHKIIAACALLAGAQGSFAHISLQDPAAAAGVSYRAAFRVSHGCDDSPTTSVQVMIPAGFQSAQPMPKPGWTIYTRMGKLEVPYESHGKRFAEGVLEIRWEANGIENALPASFYDEFVLRGTTPLKPGPLWFKVLQNCEQGGNAWVEVPASGSSTKGLKSPAALLEVLDVQKSGGGTH